MEYIVKILAIRTETHDVKRFFLEKPKGFQFVPGHSIFIAINKPESKDEKREFTMTSLNDDNILEFTIKRYDSHEGVTNKIHILNPGDELILSDMFGTIRYKNPGVWIAGGAGITPFLAIFRQLAKDNKVEGNTLIFSNKEHKDIICERELKLIFGNKSIFTLSREKREGYESGRVDLEFLKKHIKDFNQDFYVCGPDEFVNSLKTALASMKAKAHVLAF